MINASATVPQSIQQMSSARSRRGETTVGRDDDGVESMRDRERERVVGREAGTDGEP